MIVDKSYKPESCKKCKYMDSYVNTDWDLLIKECSLGDNGEPEYSSSVAVYMWNNTRPPFCPFEWVKL